MEDMIIVIAAVPYVDTAEPIMAPALLKATLTAHKIDSIAIDLNIEIINRIQHHPEKQKILDFFFSQIIHPEVIDEITEIIEYCANRIAKLNPDIIALSLLIYSCQIFTRWLCAKLRQLCPTAKIVIGGTGIKNFIADNDNSFCEQLKKLNLIDDYICGDGDISFYEYVAGNYLYPGINSTVWQTVSNLNNVPFPDYSDYNFQLYESKVIPINDSRGCIKNCEFCDIIEHWKKYQFRTADNMFEEMLLQIKNYHIARFTFRSSLVNGNMKEFKKLLDLISNYNSNKDKLNQISWDGYFIIRAPNYHPEELWSKLNQSNGTIHLGVESVISEVRHGLGKTFENDDIIYHLEMGKKYNVPLALLIIVGYPTETLADFEFTKNWFRSIKEYANNSVKFVSLSFASILPGTELHRKSNEYGIKKGKLPSIWINQNLNITSKQRLDYLVELENICRNECNFNCATSAQTIEHTVDDELY